MRRQLVVEEANAIGTAYLRRDVVSEQTQPVLREKFRRYVEARLSLVRVLPELVESNAQAAIAVALRQEIWSEALAALKEAPPVAMRVMVPALNQMIDITTTRASAAHAPTPILVCVIQLIFALICSLLAGCMLANSKLREIRLHIVAVASVVVRTIMQSMISITRGSASSSSIPSTTHSLMFWTG